MLSASGAIWTSSLTHLFLLAEAALLDTSVVIGFGTVGPRLPETFTISTVTVAELAAGPHLTNDPAERARRQQRLQWAEATFRPLPFDEAAARAYGPLVVSVLQTGRKPRRRAYDLLIAAIASSRGLQLVTRNPDDFRGLGIPVLSV